MHETDDSNDRDIEAEHRRLVGDPLYPDVLTTVMSGADRFGRWELRDGPHPLPQDPDAVRHELILRHGRRGGGILGGTGPRLKPGEVATIGFSASGGRPEYRIAYVEARCALSVKSIRVRFDDGSVTELPTSLSTSTREGWAVCPLDSAAMAVAIVFLDQDGSVLDTRAVRDPRTREPR